MSKKFDVLVQPFDYQKDRIYVTLGYNFGFALKHYEINEELYQVNPASILFLSYYKQLFAKEELKKNIEISVNPGNTIVSFVSTSKKISEDLAKLNQFLLYIPEEEFEELKKVFVYEYLNKENKFPDIFNLSIVEFLGQNKRFSRFELFNQIKEVTKEDILFAQKILLESMEAKIFIVGNLEEDNYYLLLDKLEKPELDVHPQAVFYPMASDEEVPKEIFVRESGKRDLLLHTNPVIKVSNKYGTKTAGEIFLVYQILASHYRESNPIFSIDGADFGMYIPNLQKIGLSNVQDSQLEIYIDQIKLQIDYLIQDQPKQFTKLFVNLWLSGINYVEFNERILKQPLDKIKEMIQTVLDESLYCTVNSK